MNPPDPTKPGSLLDSPKKAAKAAAADLAGKAVAGTANKAGSVDPKSRFVAESVQKITELATEKREEGETVGDRLERTVGELGESAARVAITEGAAVAVGSVTGGVGGQVTRQVLSTKVGQKAVAAAAKPVGKTAEATFSGLRKGWKVIAAAAAVVFALFVMGALLILSWMAGVSGDANVTAEANNQRASEQVSTVQPDGLLAGGKFRGNLAGVTFSAYDTLIMQWVDSLDFEVENIEIELRPGGDLWLSATRVDNQEQVKTGPWFYQTRLRECHPAVVIAAAYPNDVQPSEGLIPEKCWVDAPPVGGMTIERPTVMQWIRAATSGKGAEWKPPLYDAAHCAEVTEKPEACASWFETDLRPAGYQQPPARGEHESARWLATLPTVELIDALAGELPPTTTTTTAAVQTPDDEEGINLEHLEANSKVGDVGQAPIVEDGLLFEFEVLASVGGETLARDMYTAWVVWHNPLVHVPHHQPHPATLPDFGCAGTYIPGHNWGAGYDTVESPMWTTYADGAALNPTDRGSAWVAHYKSMGSGMSKWAEGDVLGGCVARPMLALLGYIAARKPISVSPLRSGHTPWVGSGNTESYHHRGLAADIHLVGGEPVHYPNPEPYWLWRFLVHMKHENNAFTINEIGSPWDLPDPVDGDGIWVDAAHTGHIHLGVCGTRYGYIDHVTGEGRNEKNSC